MTKSSSFFRALVFLTFISFALIAFTSGFVLGVYDPDPMPKSHTSSAQPGSLEIFQEAWDLVARDFFGPLPPNHDRVYGAARGFLAALDDPYTVFVEPIPHQFDQDDLRGSYGGVGMTLSRSADGQIVLSPLRDSPSAEAGILEGDVLVAVDGVSITAEMDVSEDIVSRIRGDVGTDVTLTIQRDGETHDYTITRQIIEIPSVNWQALDEFPTLGYIRINSFTDRTAQELEQGLNELSSSKIEGLILDLRGNGGGLLQSSIDVTDQFLAGGVILYENRKSNPEKAYEATAEGLAHEIPLVVLVNHGTASAAEIVAGAIQDHDRGTLVGETTFGKGSVQLIFDLSDGSSLHVTAARWSTPSRHQLDGAGLTPDVLVESSQNGGQDTQLERAIDLLQKTE